MPIRFKDLPGDGQIEVLETVYKRYTEKRMAFLEPYYKEFNIIHAKWDEKKWEMIDKRKATLTADIYKAIGDTCTEECNKEIHTLSEKYNVIEVL